jgi:hypothetical protein
MSAYGIMFHHFHDDQHPRGQGSISASDLVELIDHIGRDKILPPDEWDAPGVEGKSEIQRYLPDF